MSSFLLDIDRLSGAATVDEFLLLHALDLSTGDGSG